MTIHQPPTTVEYHHAKAIRARLLNPTISVTRSDLERQSQTISALNLKVAALEKVVAARDLKIGALRQDLADAQARILSQAELICDMTKLDFCDPDKRPIDAIVGEVLRDFPGITWADVISVHRSRRLVAPRHACMKAVYEQRKDLSFPRIGNVFKRDHTTIIAAVRK